jgi:hypothetical protein
MRKLFFILPLFFWMLIAAAKISHAESHLITMPPEFVPARSTDGSVKYINERALEKLFRAESPSLQKIIYNHSIKRFIIPETQWLYDLVRMYEGFVQNSQMQPQQDTWDCENYSALLNSFASLRLWNAGYTDTRMALGWMRVQAKFPWAGIPDAIHALIFAVTSKGVVVIEPQNGQSTILKDYPNKAYIEEVYLF